ncbi:hypothetical protein PQX77_007993 [Marasmius sp. AFHP31]|nr:hypothetical protein PQX77_007993 [Marasmius sp. AFHP31]
MDYRPDISYKHNAQFLFSHASDDIWPKILQEMDRHSAVMLLQVSRASHKIAIPCAYKDITITSSTQANAIGRFFNRASTETLCGGQGQWHIVCSITLGKTQELVYDEDDYATFDYHALYHLLRRFISTKRVTICQVDFPCSLLLPLLQYWSAIQILRIRHIADCVFEHEYQGSEQDNSLSSALCTPCLPTLVIEGRLELMGGFEFMCVMGRVLRTMEVRHLVVDWVTLSALHPFLDATRTVLDRLTSITVVPPSPLHPWSEYLQASDAVSFSDKPLAFAPNLHRKRSFRQQVITALQNGTPTLRYSGPITNLCQLVELDLGYWMVQDLGVWPDDRSHSLTAPLLCSALPNSPYPPLTNLSISNFTVSIEDNTFGSLFPSLQRLYLWTIQDIPAEIFNRYRESQFRSLKSPFSFEVFVVDGSTQQMTEAEFFGLIEYWGIDLDRPCCTIIRLEESVKWCVTEINDSFGWIMYPAEKVLHPVLNSIAL